MKLILVRHGEALAGAEDRLRPLSENGREEAAKIAEILKKKDVHPELIYHSSRRRAFETANIIAQVLKMPERLREREGLDPNDSVSRAVDWVSELAEESPQSEFMIVGHMPLLPDLAAELVPADNDKIRFRTGTALRLVKSPAGGWKADGIFHASAI